MYKTQVNYLKKIYTKQLCQTNISKEKLDHSEILPNNWLKCVIDIFNKLRQLNVYTKQLNQDTCLHDMQD
jgi:hypothetical protein